MAREIQVQVYTGTQSYVPDVVLENDAGEVVWNNRADPDPMRVELTPLSGHEVAQGQAAAYASALAPARRGKQKRGAAKEAADTTERVMAYNEGLISKHVTRVSGWSVNGEPATTGADLVRLLRHPGVAPGERLAIITDLVEAIGNASHLAEGLLEKYLSPSVSSPIVSTGPGAGAAPGAAVERSPNQAPQSGPSTSAAVNGTATASQTGTNPTGHLVSTGVLGPS